MILPSPILGGDLLLIYCVLWKPIIKLTVDKLYTYNVQIAAKFGALGGICLSLRSWVSFDLERRRHSSGCWLRSPSWLPILMNLKITMWTNLILSILTGTDCDTRIFEKHDRLLYSCMYITSTSILIYYITCLIKFNVAFHISVGITTTVCHQISYAYFIDCMGNCIRCRVYW